MDKEDTTLRESISYTDLASTCIIAYANTAHGCSCKFYSETGECNTFP